MKKATLFVIAAVIACSLCACGELSTNSDGEDSKQTPQSTASASPASNAGSKTLQGEGDIGKYNIKIVSAKKGKDYADKDVLIVTYQWTNNSDKEQMFSTAFSAKAYQDGVECGGITVVDGVDAQKMLSNIKPGATLEVQDAYVLNGDSDVEIEVGPWISLGEETKVVKTFSVK